MIKRSEPVGEVRVSMSKRRRGRSGRFQWCSGGEACHSVTLRSRAGGLGDQEPNQRGTRKEVTAGAGAADLKGVGTDGERGKAAGQEGFGEGSVPGCDQGRLGRAWRDWTREVEKSRSAPD